MPLISELPTTTLTRPSHGWAYVPDTGATHPIPAAVQPPSSRKRTTRDTNTTSQYSSTSAKQEKATLARLKDLDKENYKDVQTPIPPRGQGRSKAEKKYTANVRRILTYQRNFGHFLADEEAGAGETVLNAQRAEVGGTKRRTTATAVGGMKNQQPRRQDSALKATTTRDMPPPPTPTPSGGLKHKRATSTTSQQTDSQDDHAQVPLKAEPSSSSYPPHLDADPLLKTLSVPRPPSERVMQALLSEPPLSYNAARAKWSPEDDGASKARPPRHFCGVCGYWGKVKCRRCAEFTCGMLECWRGHEGVCTVPGY